MANKSDRERITDNDDGGFVNCYICEEIFQRITKTARYCNTCGAGFCEGMHGSFASGKTAFCLICDSRLKK